MLCQIEVCDQLASILVPNEMCPLAHGFMGSPLLRVLRFPEVFLSGSVFGSLVSDTEGSSVGQFSNEYLLFTGHYAMLGLQR